MRPRLALSLTLDVMLIVACVATCALFGAAVIAGGSMEPALSRGDLVLYRKGAGSPRQGDLVVLGADGHRFVHRVVGLEAGGTLVTQGDANPIPDLEPTSAEAVRGVVLAALPSGRLVARLAGWMRSARLWSQSHTRAMTETAPAEGVAPPGRASETGRARPAARAVHSTSCDLNARASRGAGAHRYGDGRSRTGERRRFQAA